MMTTDHYSSQNCNRCKDTGWVREPDGYECVQWTLCICLYWNKKAKDKMESTDEKGKQ